MTLQAMVTLDRVYISLATAPATVIQCGSAGSLGGGGQRTNTSTIDGSYREYANNRVRSILGTTVVTQQTITLRALTQAQVATVTKTWLGQTVLLRDSYGRRIYGTYLQTNEWAIPLSGLLSDVQLTFTQISYDESV